MRPILSFLFLGCIFNGTAQNVGIGTTIPTEKLHVEGNINLGGNLRLNDVSGQPVQVVMTNSNGTTQWADMTVYQHYVNLNGISGNWTVPAGVTKIKVQLWGGGFDNGSVGFGGNGGWGMVLISY